ncbi:neuronal acetylcholine receptor subunit alpha-4 [Elysia marginata]|uniref:Neuronal acetylcholine receptor subunit alpha-4 n=1 Tax=Elysia marginata TaxID=1093978 RepID=A0AAV4K066_9GAST|nr:neuronal acetylcholine receptor subunit alpha-4 [Elysia marginata]
MELHYSACVVGAAAIVIVLRCCAAAETGIVPWPGGLEMREGSINKTDETRLIQNILYNYNPAARPVYNASHTVTVKFGITLTQISDMVSAVCFGVSASNESTSPLIDGINATTELEKIISLGITSDPGVLSSGFTQSNLPKKDSTHQGERQNKIMSQGVGQVPDEQLLMERLMIGYHRYARPVVNASYMVTVKFGLTLVQISDMVSLTTVVPLRR